MRESSPYRQISWQYTGPINISGRATDIAVADRGSSRRIYVAYATSGVWKSDDNGASWQLLATGCDSLCVPLPAVLDH